MTIMVGARNVQLRAFHRGLRGGIVDFRGCPNPALGVETAGDRHAAIEHRGDRKILARHDDIAPGNDLFKLLAS